MRHIAFVAPPFLGHLNPMMALAATLGARGHRVTLFGMRDVAAVAAQHGVGFAEVGARSHPAGTLSAMVHRMAAPGGFGLFRIMADMTALTSMLCRELPDACRIEGVDGIVADQLEPAGALVAAAIGVPHVSVANALPIRRDPLLPPPFTGWRFDPSNWGVARNRGGYRVADLMMRKVSGAIRDEAARFGLERSSLEDCLSPLADLTQLVPELDFPRLHQPDTAHPCGPLRTAEVDDDLAALLGDGRPLAYASLGTLQGGREALFASIAEACRRLDLHLVIAHGGRMTPDTAAALPGHPTVRAFVPQRALLRHAVVAITNGGLNTVLDAASAGVPILVIPIAFEQGATGARVEHAGVGRTVSRRSATPHRIEDTLRAMLSDTPMHQRASAMGRTLAGAGGVKRAAEVIEEVLRTGAPIQVGNTGSCARTLEPA